MNTNWNVKRCNLWVILLLAIFAVTIISSETDAASIKSPIYSGEVSKISDPIKLQYRPFVSATLNKLTDTEYTVDGKSQSGKAPITGTYSATAFGEGLKVVLSTGQGAKKAVFELKITSSGRFLGFHKINIGGKDILNSNDAGNKTIVSTLKSVFVAVTPEFKERSYKTGDKLYDYRYNMDMFGMKASLAAKGYVKGFTKRNGRDSILVNFKGTTSSGGRGGEIKGYSVIDIRTGFVTQSETISTMSLSVDGKVMGLKQHETTNVDMPSVEGNSNNSGVASVEQRLRKLKELLDLGVITDEEAKAKRAEILDSL